MERTFIHKATGVLMHEIDYALSSLDLAQLSAADVLHLWHNHWSIENHLHYVRDVTFHEDAPQVMAAFRNVAIAAARLAVFSNIAESLRYFAQKPCLALA